MKFISPKTDFAFKKIFGSTDSKDILISFLNAILYDGKPTIEDLEIIDPYAAGSVTGLKDTYLDVKATITGNKTVIIEMQVLNVAAFGKRVIYNAAKTYGTQLKSGQGYSKLNPVIALTITDFVMFEDFDRVISRFRFKEVELSVEYPDGEIELVFLELPKFGKNLDEIETLPEKWIYFLSNTPDLDAIPDKMGIVPEIQKAMTIANQANLSPEELEDLDKRVMFLEDQRGAVLKGLEKGREQGLIEGRAEGRAEGKIEGQIELIQRLLTRRLGTLSSEIQTQIERLGIAQLDVLGEEIFELNSLEDLARWLQRSSD